MHERKLFKLPIKNWHNGALFLIIVAGFTWNLGGYPLLDPDEGRNAEVMREMAESNNYVVPHLNSLPYLDKPPLYFAAGGLAIEAFGPGEWVVRLPSVLFTTVTVLVLWMVVRIWYDPGPGGVALATFGAAPLVLGFARTTIFDSALTLFVTAGLLAFQTAIDKSAVKEDTDTSGSSANQSDLWLSIAWAAMALGIITKGPVAPALILMVAGPYALWRRNLRRLISPLSVLIFLAILIPWLAAASRQVPDLIGYAIRVETLERLFTPNLNRTGAWWYFFPILPAAALQGALITAFGFRALTRSDADRTRLWRKRFLLLWILVPLLFFTFSQSKRPHYILPLIPAIALLAGYVVQQDDFRTMVIGRLGVALSMVGLLLIAVSRFITRFMTTTAAVEAAVPGVAIVLGTVTLGAGMALWFFRNRINAAGLLMAAPVAIIPFVSGQLMRAIGHDRSSRPIAKAMERILTDDTEVMGIRAYPLSLPFYIRKTITLASTDASELTSNYIRRNHSRLMNGESPLRPQSYWREALLTCNRPRVFITREGDKDIRQTLAASLPLIIETRKFAAYGPCGVRSLALHEPSRSNASR